MQHIQLIFKVYSTNLNFFLHSSHLCMMKDNAVIPVYLVQYAPKTMDMVALPSEVTDDKYFMLGNFVFRGNASCFRGNELSLPNW